MSRRVKIPLKIIMEWCKEPIGRSIIFPVKVDWPELQLTQDQIAANAVAIAHENQIPFIDQSIFEVEIG